MASLEQLPYDLPRSVEEQISVLAEIVELPALKGRIISKEDAIKALTGLIIVQTLGQAAGNSS